VKLNPITTMYYISPCCLVFLFFPWVLIEAPVLLGGELGQWLDRRGIFIFVSNAVIAFALNCAVFLLIGKTSALTMNIAGVQPLSARLPRPPPGLTAPPSRLVRPPTQPPAAAAARGSAAAAAPPPARQTRVGRKHPICSPSLYAPTHTHTHTRMRACARMHEHLHARTHAAHTHARTHHACTHTRSHIRMHVHMHARSMYT